MFAPSVRFVSYIVCKPSITLCLAPQATKKTGDFTAIFTAFSRGVLFVGFDLQTIGEPFHCIFTWCPMGWQPKYAFLLDILLIYQVDFYVLSSRG